MKYKNTKIQVLLASLLLFFAYGGIASAASLDSEELIFVNLLNDYRKSLNRTELKITKPLLNGAEFFAQDFADHPDNSDVSIHVDTTGDAPEERGDKYGYYFLAENMGWGYETGQTMFDAWKASEGHRDNMVNSDARTIGVARYNKPGATKNGSVTEWYWIMDLSGEGTERLIGNNLETSELYLTTGYKKISLTVKKRNKTTGKYKAAKQALVKVFDKGTGQLIDKDIVSKKGKATLYTYQDPGRVILKVYSSVISTKSKKNKNFTWNKNKKYTIKYK